MSASQHFTLKMYSKFSDPLPHCTAITLAPATLPLEFWNSPIIRSLSLHPLLSYFSLSGMLLFQNINQVSLHYSKFSVFQWLSHLQWNPKFFLFEPQSPKQSGPWHPLQLHFPLLCLSALLVGPGAATRPPRPFRWWACCSLCPPGSSPGLHTAHSLTSFLSLLGHTSWKVTAFCRNE